MEQAIEAGKLPPLDVPEMYLEKPQNPEFGDYASGLALKLAKPAKSRPMTIAENIVSFIEKGDELKSVEVAPPGFINFTLSERWLSSQVEAVLTAGENYGTIGVGNGKRVQVEFVSINPTGPLHAGHGRGAILGSALANVLSAAGYTVEKEYYFNDAGNQMNLFYRTLYARYLQSYGKAVGIPEDGYAGAYMVDLAGEIIGEVGDRFLAMNEEEAIAELGKIGLAKIIGQIKKDLQAVRVEFDVWFTERSLYENGQFDKVTKILTEKGYMEQKEGATWFVSTKLGEDKDNVIIRSNGMPTYFATDIAYHYNKFIERGFDRVIDVWGADHQGHIQRLKAAVEALGGSGDALEIIIHQLVMLKRGGEVVRISKRSGDIITLREVIDEVGTDACRFFFLARSANSQMEFDLDLAKKESSDNPVFYVQYAHARIFSILRLANEKGIVYADGDTSLLTSEPELALIRKLMQLPELIEMASRTLEPHHLTYYAQDLATVFHSFYKLCRVVDEDNESMTKARLKLVEAAKIVLARTLRLMGMTAPETM